MCPELQRERAPLLQELESTLGETLWEVWNRAAAREQAAILLGASWGLSETQARRIDLATQTFLCGADSLRVDMLELPSFRSKVGQGSWDGPEDPTGEEIQQLIEELVKEGEEDDEEEDDPEENTGAEGE
jgi:hypothetical protein